MVVKKKSKFVSDLPPFDYTPIQLSNPPQQYMKCRIVSASAASPLNFEWPAVTTGTTVAMIKDAIIKRHGGAVADLVLYAEKAKPECVLGAGHDDGVSLKALGIAGLPASAPTGELPVLNVLYDFHAGDPDDALDTLGPTRLASKYGINVQRYSALDKAEATARAQGIRV